MNENTKKPKVTDTDRLNWLLQFTTVGDVGDDRLIWGPVVQGESLEEGLCNQSFSDAVDKEAGSFDSDGNFMPAKEGWEKGVVLAGIDGAIRKEREG